MATKRVFLGSIILYSLFCLGSGGPLITPSGDLDKVAVESHILHLEETIANLQSQFQAQEQKQAAVLSSLLSKLTATTSEISNLKSDYDNLEEKYNSSLTELSLVKDHLIINANELASVKSDLKALRTDYDLRSVELAAVRADQNETSRDLIHASEDIADLRGKYENTFTSLNATKEAIREAVKETADLEMDVLDVKQNITDIQQLLGSVSANLTSIASGMAIIVFSTALQHDVNLTDGQVLKYKRVLLNIGDGYNTSTGIFTCPQSGIYNFQIHAFSQQFRRISFRLFRNNDAILTIYGFDGSKLNFDGDSNSAIIHAIKGDTFSVRSQRSSYVHDLPEYGYTTFSGYLIYPDM